LADASSIHTFRWVNYFAKKGHNISIISLRPSNFDYQGIEVFWIKKIKSATTFASHLINFLPVIFQIGQAKRYIKADIFHALGSANGWLASLIGCRPLIYTIADPGIFSIPFQRKLPKIYKILNKYAIKKSDLLVCDGENTKKAMIGLGANPQKIRTIRYGVDVEKFKSQKITEEFKRNFFRENSKIVISTKPLRPECDVETLIKAIPKVLKEIPEARFLIVGEGEQKENLMNLTKSLKIFEMVKFTGWVSGEDIPLYFNLADVYACTSLVETGLAASTAEAMACGLPVVVSDSGDNRNWIKDGENGFVFPLKNSDTLAEKIIYLLKNPDFKVKTGKTNRELIERENNYYKEMEKMEKIYQELIK
jgi:glycosyltransferase involved in cell wall biosynthesis